MPPRISAAQCFLPGTPTPEDLAPDPSARLEPQETTPQQDPVSLLFNPPLFPDEPVETFRHRSWQQRRVRVAAALAVSGVSASRARRFSTCGCQAWVLRSTENPDDYRIVPDFCHDRWCVPCANARAYRITANLLTQLGDRQTRFVTLTLKASPHTLRQRIDRLLSAFANLRRRAFWKERVQGGCGFLEITRGSQGAHWHPHLHLILEGRYLPKEQLVATWLDLTGDSYVVDIKLVREQHVVGRYVTKYASKPLAPELLRSPEALAEAVAALRGRKLLYAFGTWARWRLLAQPTSEGWTLFGHVNELLYRASMGDELADLVLTVLQHSSDAFAGEVFTVTLKQERPP